MLNKTTITALLFFTTSLLTPIYTFAQWGVESSYTNRSEQFHNTNVGFTNGDIYSPKESNHVNYTNYGIFSNNPEYAQAAFSESYWIPEYPNEPGIPDIPWIPSFPTDPGETPIEDGYLILVVMGIAYLLYKRRAVAKEA